MATRSVFDSVYKVNEVARIFKLTPRAVRTLIRSGELPAIRLGRYYRVPRAVIDAFLTQPFKTSFTPADLGFGLYKSRRAADSAVHVNRMRNRNRKTLKATVAELE